MKFETNPNLFGTTNTSPTINGQPTNTTINGSTLVSYSSTTQSLSSNPTNKVDNVVHGADENSQAGGDGAPQNYANNTIAEFDVSQFYSLIEKMGYHAKWEKSMLCTCIDPETLAPMSTCPFCKGSGIRYLPPTDLRIIIQHQDKGAKYQNVGVMDSGTAIGTPQVNNYVSFRDRISVPDQQLVQSYLFNMNDKRMNQGMKIPYLVNKFLLVYNQKGDMLKQGVDFSYDADSQLFRPLSDKVQSGDNISMNLQVELRYIVIDLLKQARYQYTQAEQPEGQAFFTRMPEKLLLKREDAWIGNTGFAGTKTDKNTFIDPKRAMTTDTNGFGF